MFRRNFILTAFMGVQVFAGLASAAPQSVVHMGQGRVATFRKINKNVVVIRFCIPNTLDEEITSERGCERAKDKDGKDVSDLILNWSAFEKMRDLQLSKQVQASGELSAKQQDLLDLSLSEPLAVRKLKATQEKKTRAEKALEKNQAYKSKHPKEYSWPEEVALKNEIQECTNQIKPLEAVVKAQESVQETLAAISKAMEGSEIQASYEVSHKMMDALVLKSIAEMKPCADVALFGAWEGEVCRTSKDGVYLKLKEGWLDAKTNRTWYDAPAGTTDAPAREVANQEDRDKALTFGLAEVFPTFLPDRKLWIKN